MSEIHECDGEDEDRYPGPDGAVIPNRSTVRSIPLGFTLYRNGVAVGLGAVVEVGDVLELRGPDRDVGGEGAEGAEFSLDELS